ncbi:MAG: PaaI family thioesterase [Rhodobacteraceae bacterium]|nr:PaaI family thioesterase [Paracoccaceae bacterium]
MPDFTARNPDFATHITESFYRQGLMQTFGAELVSVEAGRVVIEQDFRDALLHQHGALHGGALATLLDTACGFAAVSLLPVGKGISTIEFKTAFLSPGAGTRFRITGQVLKAGRSITFAEGRAVALAEKGEKLIATMTASMMTFALNPA